MERGEISQKAVIYTIATDQVTVTATEKWVEQENCIPRKAVYDNI